jgi:predicted SAM-dependent methyltransferase
MFPDVARRRPREGLLRLHLGCGSTVVAGWENIDRSPNVYLARVPALRPALRWARVITEEQASAVFPSGIVRHDVRRGIPYPDASASHVYSSHMIEHMSRWQALAVVRECARVLAPGGMLRLATPDLGPLVQEYLRGETAGAQTPADRFMAMIGTFHEVPGSWAQRLARRLAAAPHQWLYDADSLVHLLKEGGLPDAFVGAFRQGEFPDLEGLEQRPDSLFVEVRRP